ncbi:SIR2 family NAD-dependent protein deacylase [Anaerorudis cellulosivorans]|uniref:SIR2 family NAD-dependent protein deacylase n=1 Tax=Anaerorudis cellulosivorans TaxID=3397862 RepID=UPI00221EA882|nr:NAD-dependent deacylase [Seramator thermalis]MCW1734526.1 NAD-dependent deacylase [Seramator thermalis]
MKKKLVVLTGAGMSAESGISTFRDSGGLWEQYPVEEVATPEAFARNPELMLNFYNARRRELLKAKPNEGHKGLADLEKYFDVSIITQNIDNLHERAGSSHVIHLHGELMNARSTGDPSLVYRLSEDNPDIKVGDVCEKGYQLRPDVVWFGEPVPMIEEAIRITRQADIFVIIGTSMVVYPAAGLLNYVPNAVPIYLIDPKDVAMHRRDIHHIRKGASEGVKELKKLLLKDEP